ncbi:tRNA nucleotidyltransferase [Aliidiomarina sp. Khilg15.8]
MEVYLVGGAVRDQLLDRAVHEYDYVVVGATPQQLLDLGYEPVGKDFPVFLHPETHAEYALARTERKSGKGYKGFDCYAAPDVTLEQDLKRRDLTVNAMAKAPDGSIIDPYGGQQDLQKRILRHVSEAFSEDPLRVLRTARFAARYHDLGFTIDPSTLQLMTEMAKSGELEVLTKERVWQEMARSLTGPSPQVFFTTLHETGALAPLLAIELPQTLVWHGLMRVAQSAEHSLPANYAAWAWDLIEQVPGCKPEHVHSQLKVPNQCRDMANLVRLLGAQLRSDFSAPNLNKVLRQADAQRRPERFAEAWRVLEVLQVHSAERMDAIKRAFMASNEVDVQQVIADGHSGAEISKVLRERQEIAISEVLSSLRLEL